MTIRGMALKVRIIELINSSQLPTSEIVALLEGIKFDALLSAIDAAEFIKSLKNQIGRKK